MSRLNSLSADVLRAMFSQESDDSLIVLLTISSAEISPTLRLADNYTGRLSETATDVVYGVTSNLNQYVFLPFTLTLPTEEENSVPRCQIIINDVTRYLTPVIRSITTPPNVQIDLVLKSDPDTVEISFGGFLLSNISYNANQITADLTVESLAVEPFPSHTFTPSYFPGLF